MSAEELSPRRTTVPYITPLAVSQVMGELTDRGRYQTRESFMAILPHDPGLESVIVGARGDYRALLGPIDARMAERGGLYDRDLVTDYEFGAAKAYMMLEVQYDLSDDDVPEISSGVGAVVMSRLTYARNNSGGLRSYCTDLRRYLLTATGCGEPVLDALSPQDVVGGTSIPLMQQIGVMEILFTVAEQESNSWFQC